MEAFAAEHVWPAPFRRRLDAHWRLKLFFVFSGMLLGIGGATVYYLNTPIRFQSVATFVVAPNSLASTSSQSLPLSGSPLSAILGGSNGFSEIDVYLGRIHSRDFMQRFLAENPAIVKDYRPYLGDRADADPKNLPLVVVDSFLDFIQTEPTSSPRILSLNVQAPEPRLATDIGTRFLMAMNAMVRDAALREHGGRLNYLRQQVQTAGASTLDLRESLARLVMEELRIVTLVEGSQDYGVQVIDRPTFNPVRIWPRKSIIFGLGLLNGALFGALAYWLIYSRRWF